MANPEHLAILRRGVQVWDQWRTQDADKSADLAGGRFVERRTGTANLSRANLGDGPRRLLLPSADTRPE